MAHQLEKEEPAIIGFGRMHMQDYTEKDYRESLTKAFGIHEADYVTLDSNPRNQKFQAAAIAWAIDNIFLYNDKNTDTGQSIISSFRLTETGKKEFLI